MRFWLAVISGVAVVETSWGWWYSWGRARVAARSASKYTEPLTTTATLETYRLKIAHRILTPQ
jgi:hypothetical protein